MMMQLLALVVRPASRARSAIAAARVFATFALLGSAPAYAQAPPPPPAAEAWKMMGADSAVNPSLHGYRLDNGVFTIIDAPGAILGTAAFGINNRGQIVGFTVVTPTMADGFLLAKRAFTGVQFPGASTTEAGDINERDQIVGVYVDDTNTPHGFLLDKGVFITIDVPGSFATSAIRINARGQIVGGYSDVGNARPITPIRGFLFADGVFTRINVPGATETLPHGINDRGQIVGAYVDAEGTIHGFLLDKGVLTTIDVPDAAVPGTVRGFGSGAVLGSAALGINNRGQIVGQYADADGAVHGFLLEDGVFTTIDAPGAINTAASDINDKGQIVGFFLGTVEGRAHFAPIQKEGRQ